MCGYIYIYRLHISDDTAADFLRSNLNLIRKETFRKETSGLTICPDTVPLWCHWQDTNALCDVTQSHSHLRQKGVWPAIRGALVVVTRKYPE